MLDLRGDTPTAAPDAPEILASLPVREVDFADDPAGLPGNAVRQSFVAEAPAPESTETVSTPPAESDETEAGSYPGPLFTVPEPARMPTAERSGGAEADTLVRPPEADDDLPAGGLFSRGARAWRPNAN